MDGEFQEFADDLARRRKWPREPKRIANAVNDLLARQGYARVQAVSELDALWRDIVGPKLAAETRVGNQRRGVLEITVRNSAVAQELTFQKRQVLNQLSARASEQKIRDLRFRVGSVD